jgi:superfamily I DNA/RNA helicase
VASTNPYWFTPSRSDRAPQPRQPDNAKGTEFSRVVVIGAEAGVVPLDWAFENQPESEHVAVRGRERSLFYVACSRARDELIITWTGAPSPFLPLPAA